MLFSMVAIGSTGGVRPCILLRRELLPSDTQENGKKSLLGFIKVKRHAK